MDEFQKKVHQLLEAEDDIIIEEPFEKKEVFWYCGQIRIEAGRNKLFFFVRIPEIYPLTNPNLDNISIEFINEEFIGLSHVNLDGSICLHPKKDDDFNRKFKTELEELRRWIKECYLEVNESARYEYLLHPIDGDNKTELLFCNTKEKFKLGQFGKFSYALMATQEFERLSTSCSSKLFVKLGFERKISPEWASSFLDTLDKNEVKFGLWCYIEKEPLKKSSSLRKIVETWAELQDYLPQDFIKEIYDGVRKKFGEGLYVGQDLFILVGYKIPNDETYEIHWNLIKLNKNHLPIETKKVSTTDNRNRTAYVGECTNDKIRWGKTTNIDYTRFFGRGKLPDRIANARMLLFGAGALGSELSVTFVRGGIKTLMIQDFDTVSSGNICRSTYKLNDIGVPKVWSLRKNLNSISPFVNVNILDIKVNIFAQKSLENQLNEDYDILIDCTADPEMLYVFDSFKDYRGEKVSLALTNNAQELVCLTGSELTVRAKKLFDLLDADPPNFYEGTGCGYPTFSASSSDINSLLNPITRFLGIHLGKNEDLTMIALFDKDKGVLVKLYETYFQAALNSHVFIAKNAISKLMDEVQKKTPDEFGGIFIGRYSGAGDFLIDDIIIADEYKNSSNRFTRFPGSLNSQLNELHSNSDGNINYIGEWHSHPNSNAKPSTIDIEAMKEIANDSKINISCPILLIAGNTGHEWELKIFSMNQNELMEYEK